MAARTRGISVARAITRDAGYRIASGATDRFLQRVAALQLPPALDEALAPIRHVMEVLDEELSCLDTNFETVIADDPVIKRLMTCPSIGAITAAAFVAALDDVGRFAGRQGAAQVASYLGLVPREYSSGEQQHRGRVLPSALRMSTRCWSKPPGACAGPPTHASPPFGAGNGRLNADSAKRLRSSRWPDGWLAFSTRWGETGPTTSRRRFARISRTHRQRLERRRRRLRVGPTRSSSWRSKRADVPGRM